MSHEIKRKYSHVLFFYFDNKQESRVLNQDAIPFGDNLHIKSNFVARMARSVYRAFRIIGISTGSYLGVTHASICVRGAFTPVGRLKLKRVIQEYTILTARTHARENSIFDEEFNDYSVSKLNSSCRDDGGDRRRIDLAKLT